VKKIIIGSTALKYWFNDFNRTIKDLDYAVDQENVKRNKHIEYLYNPIIFKYLKDDDIYVSPEILLTLKMSHISWDINFKKHMYDIQFMLKKNIKYNKELYKELFDFWTNLKGREKKYRRSDLTLKSKEFFDNGIKFDHDYLHTLIKDVPTYTKILKDGAEVEPSEEKFLNLSHNDKLSVIEEEVMVMAYERFRNQHYIVAYNKMLQKFITGHAPFWQLIFIIENYLTLKKPTFNYYKQIENYKQIKK